MRRWILGLLFLAAASFARAETFTIPGSGRFTVAVAGEWKITGDDQGDRFQVTITPKSAANAQLVLVVNLPPEDKWSTKSKLRDHLVYLCEDQAAESVEKKAKPRPFYSQQGFGFFCRFTDPALVGQPPREGNHKLLCLGIVRLAPKIYVSVSLLADDEQDEAFQQLMGAVEGMEFAAATSG